MPYGCFEQTSSTTYPNVLALDYLKRTGKTSFALEQKARHYIHLGYQRLLTFEVAGGGFDWYGRGPANVALSAYGLMEFQDMARVHDVDPKLIDRTRAWLLSKRGPDGSWAGDGRFGGNHAGTAYVAWAVFQDAETRKVGGSTLAYLLSRRPETISDPYTLALVCNALLALDPQGATAGPYLERLESMKQSDGKMTWWQQGAGGETMFYGRGQSGDVETTALAVLALTTAKRSPGLTRSALAWLVARKDPRGTWYSTQATVLALKALLAGTRGISAEKDRRIRIRLGRMERDLKVPADQTEVVQQVNLTQHLRPGRQTLHLSEVTGTEPAYQVTFRYHVPRVRATPPKRDLLVTLDYDRTAVAVGDTVKAKATVKNRSSRDVSMVMLELPVPAGFALVSDDLSALVSEGRVDRFQTTGRGAIVYLRRAESEKPLELSYRLRATTPVKVAVPGARVYAYYDPHNEGHSPGTHLTVTQPK
jgi:uncharacterized protein YfaS (alpha-2-macroglobulin family)